MFGKQNKTDQLQTARVGHSEYNMVKMELSKLVEANIAKGLFQDCFKTVPRLVM